MLFPHIDTLAHHSYHRSYEAYAMASAALKGKDDVEDEQPHFGLDVYLIG